MKHYKSFYNVAVTSHFTLVNMAPEPNIIKSMHGRSLRIKLSRESNLSVIYNLFYLTYVDHQAHLFSQFALKNVSGNFVRKLVYYTHFQNLKKRKINDPHFVILS